MKAKLTGRKLAHTVEKQRNFSKGGGVKMELPRGGSKEGKVSRGRVEGMSVVVTHGEVWEDRSLG